MILQREALKLFQKATSTFETYGQHLFSHYLLPVLKYQTGCKTCEALMKEPGFTIQGLHIEGPYLNKKWRGSQWEEF